MTQTKALIAAQTAIPVRTLKEIAIELMMITYVLVTDREVLCVIMPYQQGLERIAKQYNLDLIKITESSSKLFVTGEFKLK